MYQDIFEHFMLPSAVKLYDCLYTIIHAEGGLTKYCVHIHEHSFQKADILHENTFFYWFYVIFKFSEILNLEVSLVACPYHYN